MHLWITLCFAAVSLGQESPQKCLDQEFGCVEPLAGSKTEPEHPNNIGIEFLVHNTGKRGSLRANLPWNARLARADKLFNPRSSLTFIVHGFLESKENSTIENLKNAVSNRESHTNVIVVNWGKGAFFGDTTPAKYPQAANNALWVGRALAVFIKNAIRVYGVRQEQIHIIGHSLGGEIMGMATTWLHGKGIKIARGTASDAARPFFATETKGSPFLNRANVGYMLAIHTSASGDAKPPADSLGVYLPFAHVDLYPNGGIPRQPECAQKYGPDPPQEPVSLDAKFCSHIRGYIYLTEMLNRCRPSCSFSGSPCGDVEAAVGNMCDQSSAFNVCNVLRGSQRGPNGIYRFDTDGDAINFEGRGCTNPQRQYAPRQGPY